MKKKYKFFPKILQAKDGDYRLALLRENDEGKQYFSEAFTSLADALSALNFIRLAVFEICREDSIAPLSD